MAEEEKDDWLDDLDSPEEQASELDQSDIDALLSGSDDLVTPAAASAPGEEAGSDLDQSDIDALLSGSDDLVTPAAASTLGEEAGSDLDQSDIDALLSGSDDLVTPAAATSPDGEVTPELDQSDIDALLAGTGDGEDGGFDGGDLDQADIDALLSGPNNAGNAQGISDPDQDEIDKLFSDIDSNDSDSFEETPFPAEEIDFEDVFNTSDTATQSGLPNFDAEEFKLSADIPDIPDTSGFDMETTTLFSETPPSSSPPPSPPSARDSAPIKAEVDDKPIPPKKHWHLPANRKVLYGAGAGMATLLIVAGVFFFKGGHQQSLSEEAPHQVAEHQGAQQSQPVTEQTEHVPDEHDALPPAAVETAHPETQVHNGTPIVKDLDLIMPPDSNQLAVSLCGMDPNNDPLEYEFQSMPAHGKLTGHAPYLVYVPKPDYSGPDTFTIRASDGKNFSEPATVKIMRQPPVAEAANDVQMAVADEPLSPPEPVHRTAAKPRRNTVPVFASHRVAMSKSTRVAVKKNQAPVIVLQPVATNYPPGATVVLNASQTKDDKGDTLSFHWEQLAGVPVKINAYSPYISFVAPSFFNTVSDPRLVFQVTATDQDGAQDRKDISVTIESRRTSALWGYHE